MWCACDLFYLFVIIDILKYFNQNVTGYSTGKGKQQTPNAFFNQAVAGAKSKWVSPEAFSAESDLNSSCHLENVWTSTN